MVSERGSMSPPMGGGMCRLPTSVSEGGTWPLIVPDYVAKQLPRLAVEFLKPHRLDRKVIRR
jgi:hypothetical protein